MNKVLLLNILYYTFKCEARPSVLGCTHRQGASCRTKDMKGIGDLELQIPPSHRDRFV